MVPGSGGSIVFKPVFSSTPAAAVRGSVRKAEAALADPAMRRLMLREATRARDYLRTWGTEAAAAKSGELKFLIVALQRLGV